jgi:hypothetical protein
MAFGKDIERMEPYLPVQCKSFAGIVDDGWWRGFGVRTTSETVRPVGNTQRSMLNVELSADPLLKRGGQLCGFLTLDP